MQKNMIYIQSQCQCRPNGIISHSHRSQGIALLSQLEPDSLNLWALKPKCKLFPSKMKVSLFLLSWTNKIKCCEFKRTKIFLIKNHQGCSGLNSLIMILMPHSKNQQYKEPMQHQTEQYQWLRVYFCVSHVKTNRSSDVFVTVGNKLLEAVRKFSQFMTWHLC